MCVNNKNKSRGDISKLREVAPIPFGRIQLCDEENDEERNTDGDDEEAEGSSRSRNKGGNWCVGCSVTDPVVVRGDNLGRYVVWRVRFELRNGGRIEVKRRYSDFVALRRVLVQRCAGRAAVAALPGKGPWWADRFSGEFLERRRRGLEWWLAGVVLDGAVGALAGEAGEALRAFAGRLPGQHAISH